MSKPWEDIRAGIEALERFYSAVLGQVEVSGIEGATRALRLAPKVYRTLYGDARQHFAAALAKSPSGLLLEITRALPEFQPTEETIFAAKEILERRPALVALAFDLEAGGADTGTEPASLSHGQAAAMLYQLRGFLVSELTCKKYISERLKSPEHRHGKRYLRQSVIKLAEEMSARATDRAE